MRLPRPSGRAPLLLVCGVAACSPLRIEGMTPTRVAPGGALVVTGAGFASGLSLTLEGPGLEVQLQDLSVDDATTASGVVPTATPPGDYELVAELDGSEARFDGLRVVTGGVSVHFLDIGQGDATLVVAPGGESLLIDGGPRDAASSVRDAVSTLARGRLDAVVLSHTDADHLGGLVELLAGADELPGTSDDIVPSVRSAYADDGSCTSDLCGDARSLLAWPFSVPSPGDVIPLGDAEVTIVAADGDVGSGRVAGVDDENERSLVVRVDFGGRSVLILGDLTGGGSGEADVEGPLALQTGPVDVVRVAHHGSNTSSSAAAYDRWQPRALVLSLGSDNAFCHPGDEALLRLVATGAPIYSTGAGIVGDTERCGGPTPWPASARVGLGTMTLEMGVDGSLKLQGDEL